MSQTILIIMFTLFYGLIIFEYFIRINKGALAILAGSLLWLILSVSGEIPAQEINQKLLHHLFEIASIIFFLKGAMSIVEIIDSCSGINLITERIHPKSYVKLMWIISATSFLLSAILDNLTTAIVMMSFAKKLNNSANEKQFLAGLIIIASNAGGAWSPIGDVTTTMLWVTERISSWHTIKMLLLPSIFTLLIPLLFFSVRFRNKSLRFSPLPVAGGHKFRKSSWTVLITGITSLILVPIIKYLSGLPPFIGIFFGLGLTWLVAEFFVGRKNEYNINISKALQKVDLSSVYFFTGILLAVSALESAGILRSVATIISNNFSNINLFVVILGILSAIIDNVPLVSAVISMYNPTSYPIDHGLWTFLALVAGTGGSLLIIGSAAGVAIMNIAKIDFFWYLKFITPVALIGYSVGIIIYFLQMYLGN